METVSKTFWQRPEGKFGIAMLIPVIALLVWGGVTLLPFVILALQNTIMTVALLVTLIVIAVVLLDPRFWNRLGALYAIAMRAVTGMIIDIDPIAIIKNHLVNLKDSLLKMDEQLNLLKGQESKLSTKISKNAGEIDKLITRASKAKQLMEAVDPADVKFLEYKSVVALDGNQAARLQGSNARLTDVLNKILNLRKILEKMRTQADYVYKDMTLEVAVQEDEYKAVGAGHKAFKAAMSVLKGDDLSKELYDESMERMAERMGNQLGEIERFMENSGSFLTSMDVDNEMFAEKGLKMIEEWSQKGGLQITSPKEVPSLVPGYKPSAIPLTVSATATTKSKYLK